MIAAIRCACGRPKKANSMRCRACWITYSRVQSEAFFWSQIAKTNGCWEWQGAISTAGYGSYRGGYVHRIMCERFNGPIPAGYQVDHLCRNTRCVNPAHLE